MTTERDIRITDPDLTNLQTPLAPDRTPAIDDATVTKPLDLTLDPFYELLGESLERGKSPFAIVSENFVDGDNLIITEGVLKDADQTYDLIVTVEPLDSTPETDGSIIFESPVVATIDNSGETELIEVHPVFVANDSEAQIDIQGNQVQRRLKPLTEEPIEINSTRRIFEKAGEKVYDKIGRLLLNKVGQESRKFDEIVEEVARRFKDLSDAEVEQIVMTFVEAGFFAVTKKGNIKRTDRVEGLDELGSSEIRSAIIAHDAMQVDQVPDQRKIRSIKDIKEAYKKRKKDYVEKLTLETEGNRVLYISEVLMGNNATDVDYLARVIKTIRKLPDNMKPNVIVASGLLEGSHKFRNKDRRLGLQLSLGEQFEAGKVILDKLKELGVPVVYVMSNDDREIAHDGTVETMRIMENLQRPLADSKKQYVPYYQVDQMKQSEAWDMHKRFQLDVAFEYSLRTGRRLRSADEISELTGGRLRMEEYLLLWEAHQAIINGENVPEYISRIIDIDSIPVPGKEREDLIITDGVDLSLVKKTSISSSEVTAMIREGLSFGDKPAYQDPTVSAERAYKQLIINGEEIPDSVVILDQQQAFGIGNREGWVLSAGGLTDSSVALKQKGTIARAGLPAAWRHTTTRRILSKPSVTLVEQDPEVFKATFPNATLLDKADSNSDRYRIALFNDWQTGSITARPDLQLKWTDYVFSRLMQEGPVRIITDGDIIHGRNYRGMTEENVPTKLTRIEDQLKFVREMMMRGTMHISPNDLLNGLDAIDVVPGNHEYDSFYRDTGTAFADYIAGAFREMLLANGMNYEEVTKRVKAYERFRSSAGDHVQAWTAIIPDAAGYGLVAQHKIQEKGAKGNGAKAPVYQAQAVFEGMGSDGQNIDFGLFAHWHHPQYGVFADKVGLVAPSIAGLSGFEWMRGYRPVLGGLVLELGGGLPPQAQFYSKTFLDNWKIREGEFSDKGLKASGFKDDKHFDPAKHGYLDQRGALQKALYKLAEEIVVRPQSSF